MVQERERNARHDDPPHLFWMEGGREQCSIRGRGSTRGVWAKAVSMAVITMSIAASPLAWIDSRRRSA
jgi:hypothetical protein